MQGFYADIWMPRAVEISVSDDDRHYTPLAAVENDIPFEYKQDCYREFGWSGQTAARYVRLKARHNGHPGGFSPTRLLWSNPAGADSRDAFSRCACRYNGKGGAPSLSGLPGTACPEMPRMAAVQIKKGCQRYA